MPIKVQFKRVTLTYTTCHSFLVRDVGLRHLRPARGQRPAVLRAVAGGQDPPAAHEGAPALLLKSIQFKIGIRLRITRIRVKVSSEHSILLIFALSMP